MLSFRTKTSLLVAAGLTCTLATSSFAQDGKANQSTPKDHVIAKLQLKDGGMVQFNEASPGELVTTILAPSKTVKGGPAVNGVDVRKLGKLSAPELYRTLSGGQVAPAALVAAQQRVDQARRAPRKEPSRNGAAPKEPPIKLPSLAAAERTSAAIATSDTSGAWFQANYCPTGGYSFNYCLLYRTGDAYIQDNASFMVSTLYPIQGNVTHALQSLNCFLWMCSWHTDGQWTVPQGYVELMYVSGWNQTRRAAISDGSGHVYHWAVYGY